MSYTRKEIASWVESQSRFKLEDLRNGVFFCKMLQIAFSEEKVKFNSSPVSDYDCSSNLNTMKKTLNKHGLQLNLNVSEVLNSKNNF